MTHKVLLVGPTKRDSGKDNWGAPPLGIHRLASWLRKIADCEVRINDPCQEPPTENDFRWATHIGFSPLDETLANDIALMKKAKRTNPAAILIAGGVEATLNYQEIFDKSDIDGVVLGMGERALESIVCGKPPHTIPGVVWRTYNKPISSGDLWQYYQAMDFSQMGYESYWDTTGRLYAKPNWQDIRTVRLVTSSHCNRGCAFCSVTQWQKSATGKITVPAMLTAGEVIQMVAKVKSEVPTAETIYFCEDDFCQSRNRAEDFCDVSADLGLTYLVQTHSSRVDEELIKTLARGGVRHLTLGIENASPNVLKLFRKPQDLDKIPKVIGWCKDARIVPYLLIILFAPNSTIEDMKLNHRILSEWITMGATVSVEPFTMPYRGAPLYDSEYDFGWSVVEIPGSDHKVKHPTVIYPNDPECRRLMEAFQSEWPRYKTNYAPKHSFKGETGKLMIDLLGTLLSEGNNEPV